MTKLPGSSRTLVLVFRTKVFAKTILEQSNCCSEPVSYAAVGEDGNSGLVIEVLGDMDKVCADVVLLHCCPQSCMPNPVEGLLEVYEDMLEVLLVLQIFLTENA